MKIKNFIKIWSKNYSYSIEEIDSEVSKITCLSAKLDQEFLNEDIVWLLKDLPSLIKSEQNHLDKQDSVVRFRVSAIEKIKLQEKVKKSWYKTISAFIKDKILD